MKIASLAATLTSLALSLGSLAALPASSAQAAQPCSMSPVALGSGIRVSVPFDVNQTGASAMMNDVKAQRSEALTQNVDWEGVPLRTWLSQHGISESTYLNPTWSRDMELIALQRSAESEFTWDDGRPNGEAMLGSVASSGIKADRETTLDLSVFVQPTAMKAVTATGMKSVVAKTTTAAAEPPRVIATASAHGTADLPAADQAALLVETVLDPTLNSYGAAMTSNGAYVLEGSARTGLAATGTEWAGTCQLTIPFRAADLKVISAPHQATVGVPTALSTKVQWIPGLPNYTESFPASGTYTSSNPAVATVSGTTLNPLAVGTTTLTMASGGQTLAFGAVTVSKAVTLGTVTIANTPRLGYGLVAKVSSVTPSDATLTYQWSANGVAIAGATRVSFTPTAAQVGKRISVRVTATKAGYTTAVRGSSQTAAVAPGTLTTAIPTIANTPRVGYGLIAKPGTWGPAPVTFTYQWSANGVAIPGATRASYTPTAAMKGKRISVRVTGSKPGYTSVVKGSSQTAPVA